MIELYKNIKEKRRALGLTQTELALKVGYSEKSSIARIENGLIDIPLSKVQEFARALDCTASELMGDDGIVDPRKEELIEVANKLDDYFLGKLVDKANQLLELQNAID